MTRQATFKQKIRARMQKTGERYAAARSVLLANAVPAPFPKGATIVPGYQLLPGVQRESARLAAALRQAGVVDPATGAPFTETKVHGLMGGIGFMYFLFEYRGFPPLMSFVCRSWSMPGPLLERALAHAGILHELSATGSSNVAAKALDDALAAGKAAHVTVDAASLPWVGADQTWVGQMPMQLNVIGTLGADYVVDVGNARVLPRDVLTAARAAAKKEKHRLVTFSPGAAGNAPAEAARRAIEHTARSFRESPFKGFAGNFGLQGLRKAANLMRDSKDPKSWSRVFHDGPLAYRALYRTFECAMIELTAPAGGRAFYADFLDDAAKNDGLSGLAEVAALARQSGERFEHLAEHAVAAGGEVMTRAIELTEQIDELRRSGGDVGEQVRAMRQQRDALGDELQIDDATRVAAFVQLGEDFAAIAAIEQRLVEVLERVAG